MSAPPAAEPWDLVAPHYETDVAPLFRRYAEEALRLAGLAPGARVVDVAAGTGTLALLAAERGAARVDAVDFAPGMVARLEQRARALGLAQVAARVADGHALPFPDGTFDAAFSLAGVIFFQDRARGLAELARVVRPGGAVVVSSWPPPAGALAILFGLIGELSGRPRPPGGPPLGDAPSYARELGAVGLREVHVVEVAHAAEYPGVEELLARQERSSVPLALLRRGAGEAWPEQRAWMAERLRAALGDGRVVVELPALVGVGRKPS